MAWTYAAEDLYKPLVLAYISEQNRFLVTSCEFLFSVLAPHILHTQMQYEACDNKGIGHVTNVAKASTRKKLEKASR